MKKPEVCPQCGSIFVEKDWGCGCGEYQCLVKDCNWRSLFGVDPKEKKHLMAKREKQFIELFGCSKDVLTKRAVKEFRNEQRKSKG